MRNLPSAFRLLVLALPLPLAAQSSDPDVRASGSGALPPGWAVRLDNPAADPKALSFAPMAPGWHATTGPAALVYRPADVASGEYVVQAVMHQTKAPAHPEAYGLFLGGADVDKANQSYFYFLVRGDGKFTVKHRAGNEVHTLVDWTENAAVAKQATDGTASNTLAVRVDADSVRFLVNARSVQAFPRTALGAVGGQAGLRINHNLDVHVSSLEVTRAKR